MDAEALKKFEETLSFDGERYQVCLPFYPRLPDLPDNLNQVRRHLMAVERRLKAHCRISRTVGAKGHPNIARLNGLGSSRTRRSRRAKMAEGNTSQCSTFQRVAEGRH
ncbi:hypothetical protein T11_9085 [Trichinella zimbabwensis]|uniref:Uncharacterized protein n=1 Tax=Trichinella zimbabwensis TaxID=268475 RepID=A0A0V1GV33_9BILA|nr:hypothetical protein T11_9085 [Trichinella zimbabwensis]